MKMFDETKIVPVYKNRQKQIQLNDQDTVCKISTVKQKRQKTETSKCSNCFAHHLFSKVILYPTRRSKTIFSLYNTSFSNHKHILSSRLQYRQSSRASEKSAAFFNHNILQKTPASSVFSNEHTTCLHSYI